MHKKPLSHLNGFPTEVYLSVKDYLVSGETFDLYHDKDWDMLMTHPQPENLAKYYASDQYQPHKKKANSYLDRIYHLIRNYSFGYKKRIIKTYHPRGKRLLDYGTGTGEFLKYMSKETYKVSGVEPNKKARQTANKQLHNNVSVSIDEVNEKFDIITLWHVLEHVPHPDELIEKLKKRLLPGGIIVIAVPNFKAYDSQYYQNFWASYDVPRHLWHFSSKAIQNLFKQHKMDVIGQKPLYFDSFYISLWSEQYKTGKKRLIPALYRGLLSNVKAVKTGEYSSLIYIISA